jgi:hypothetical protein
LMHPQVFLVLLVALLALAVWLVPKIWRFLKRLVGYQPSSPPRSSPARIAAPRTSPGSAAPAPR